MNKKRLEEIKDRVLIDKVYYEFNDSKGRWGKTYTLSDEDYEYLTQQAERVEELEELEQEYVDLNSDFTKLALENKRYREILSYVREIDCVDWNKEELAEIARQALEESK